MGSEICADEGPQAERCSLALALPAPPIPPHNMRAPTRSSREATENIVCLVLSHLREIYHCHFQSLSRPGFKLQEWHSHFYCSAYLGLLSALTKLIPCSGWSVLTFPPTLCWSHWVFYQALASSNWSLGVGKKIKRAAPEGTFARSEL